LFIHWRSNEFYDNYSINYAECLLVMPLYCECLWRWSSSAIFQSCCLCDEERKHKTNKRPFDFVPDSLCLCNGGKESNNNDQRWHAQHNGRIPIIIHNFGSTPPSVLQIMSNNSFIKWWAYLYVYWLHSRSKSY
jgi:hypothetical protein